ncbi:MAG: flagellar hook-associated protein FlgK [Aquabacterium sp.]
MPTSMLMSLGTRAMFAAYSQLQTTSHNIANANVEGYSRQKVLLATAPGQFSGSGFFGRGVNVQSVVRAANAFLSQQATFTQATASSDTARRDMLRQLEKVFGSGSAGLGMASTQLFNAFSDLASAPADLPARQTVLARAEDFAAMARSGAYQIEALQANVFQDLGNAVSEINTLARGVATLNLQIATAQGLGHTPNDLLDRRAQLVSALSEKIEVSTVSSGDGSLSLFIAGGQSLVLRGDVNTLVAAQSEYDPARAQLQIDVSGQRTPLPWQALGGGLVHGLLKFQNDDLVEARNRLGQVTGALALQVNQQQALGLDLNAAAGAAMFRVGSPVAVPAQTNIRDSGGNFAAVVSLSVADASALKASEYELRPDPANAGQYLVTRLSDGQTFSGLVDGSTLDGFTIDIGTTAPAAGDRFLLKPVSTMAAKLERALDAPRGIAAANPLTAQAGSTNTGSASIGQLVIASAPSSAYQDMSLQFTNGNGDWQLLDASANVLATGTWTPGQPIAWNGFELSLNGVPANGDQFSLQATTHPAANNGNALAFSAMGERTLVDGSSVADSYASTLTELGVRVQGAMTASETSHSVSARAREALTAETGVNLDEEAARLVEYQQSYQAAAKLLQTAQSVMDTLLELGR